MNYIYIISQARHKEGITAEDIMNGNFEYETGIKIGFTADLNDRMSAYKCDAARNTLLFTISDETITKEDESRLHKYFDRFRVKGEWFEWNREIIEFFQTYTNISEIRSIIPELGISKKKIKSYLKTITPVLNIMIREEIGVVRESDENDVDLVSRLEKKYLSEGVYVSSALEFIDTLDLSEEDKDRIRVELNKSSEVQDLLDKFRSIPYYHDRMKFVCDLGNELEPNKFNLFLNSSPISFKKYYTMLGPERCGTAKYQKGNMEAMYQTDVDNQSIDIRSEIMKYFSVGNRYLSSKIKEKLGEIYGFCNYKKSPKATDLGEFFEIKKCLIPNKEKGKRDPGFELVSKKEVID